MLKKKKLIGIICIIITILSITCIVNASSFTFNAKAKKEVVNLGDEVIIDLDISNINAGKEGINVVEMFLNYDKEVLEGLEFVKQNNWKEEYNSENGKLLFVKIVAGQTEDENIGQIKFKVKKDTKVTETEVKLNSITSNDGKELIDEGNRIIKIKIKQNERNKY